MKRNILRIGNITLTLAAVFSIAAAPSVKAAPDSMFPRSTPLSSGHWVKFDIGESGIYEISYEELRNMGFSNPAKVGVYGRGGMLQPTQFVPVYSTDEAYTSELRPVAVMHLGDKIYFYGQDTNHIRYYTEMHNRTNGQRFERKTANVFTNEASYFLSDCGIATNEIEQAPQSTFNARLPEYTTVWDYFFHEKDLNTYVASGREFFGESFLDTPELHLPYTIPGAIEDSPASLVCRAVMSNSKGGIFNYGLSADEKTSEGSTLLPALETGRYYMNAEPAFLSLTLPGASGNVDMSINQSGASFASLDYVLLGAKRSLTFQPGENALRAFVYDYTPQTYGYVRFDNAPENVIVWDITDSQNVVSLPVEVADGVARAKYLGRNKKNGLMVAFNPEAQQKSISNCREVENQNLHSLGINSMPGMVIITLPELLPAAEKIAAIHKETEGMDVAIVLSDEVVNEFSAGVPDPMAYRALAKMLYDRDNADNRVFKNLLLLGPVIRDNRDILGITPQIGTLISNQSYLARDIDNTYCLADWYGMLDDTTLYTPDSVNLYRVPMSIGVGIIPVTSLADAMVVAGKIEQAYSDTSYAQWLNEYIYVSDGTDRNEHQNWCENLWEASVEASANSITGRKLYNNLYDKGGTKKAFLKYTKEGALLNTYVGHASSVALNDEFWQAGDEHRMTNRRLGFMNFAACSVAPFDDNNIGVGGRMLLQSGAGILGTILTSRAGYSSQNYEFMDRVAQAMHLDEVGKPEGLLSEKRTLGEVYKLAKTNLNLSNNEFAYHLVGDPAMVLPFPTASVTSTLQGEDKALAPGSTAHFTGEITDRKGNLLSDFNGSVVIKLYAAPVQRATSTRFGSPSVMVTLDENLLMNAEYEVVNGKFDADFFVPVNLAPTAAEAPATLRMSAYDADSRTAATGSMKIDVAKFDESKVVEDDSAPVITEMYIDTPLRDESMPVGEHFTLYATVEDDHGILLNGMNGLSTFYILVDGLKDFGSLTDAITSSDNGKKINIALPVSGLTEGRHTLTLYATDGMEQTASRSVQVLVGTTVSTQLQVNQDGPARESVSITVEDNDGFAQAVIDVLDHNGRQVYSAPVQGSQFEWNLTDSEGNRVKQGIYYAVARLYNGNVAVGVTAPAQIIVFK